jgi:hypothetical protein
MDSLLHDIELFLAAQGMSATRFGEEARGDRRLVHDLRKGREVRRSTEAEIRAFMLTYKAEAA